MSLFYFIGLVLLSCSFSPPASCSEESPLQKTYIIHVHKPPPEHTGTHREWHESFLPWGSSRLVYSYGHVFSGFAARLTEEELQDLSMMPGFVNAELSRVFTLDTTHSPNFLGLHQDAPAGFWSTAGFGKGVIIGILDTGITPTHPSFNDEGMPPPPARWRGQCSFNSSTLCNNKIIGARTFFEGEQVLSYPFDDAGHGTHTAGTAAGRFVANASLLGSAKGTAAGMAPEAHLAIYRVCNATACGHADILAGIESAVEDGVDVISFSIGGRPVALANDSTAAAMFGAVKNGVFVSASAGNRGPEAGTVGNAAPWLLTVGASSIDRRIIAVVSLGNGVDLEGESAYQPVDFPSTLLPLVFPQSTEDDLAMYCSNQATLESIGVAGKVVLCVVGEVENVEKGKIVKAAGGAAMILMNLDTRGFEVHAEAHVIPAAHVSNYYGQYILDNYINSTISPMATIAFKGTVIGEGSAPAVAAFSSRGPSIFTPGILKPDVIGPGLNVLAAWPTPVGPYPLTPAFNMISGTSMSCPHLSGIAALLKAAHPDWSPAMIKSAIMTTTETVNLNGGLIRDLWLNTTATFYDMGAGHVNPLRASNPGLVYDIQTDDYISYLCGLGYSDNEVALFTHERVTCANYTLIDGASLNYPSFQVALSTSRLPSRQTLRTVTNVGAANSSYVFGVARPPGVTVSVVPDTLVFTEVGQKKSYIVTFGLNSTEAPALSSWTSLGYLGWVSADSSILVSSPVIVTVIS